MSHFSMSLLSIVRIPEVFLTVYMHVKYLLWAGGKILEIVVIKIMAKMSQQTIGCAVK